MPRFTRRRVLGALLVLVVPLAVYGFLQWQAASDRGGQTAATPFRIAGNLYYVGASDVAAFLITGRQGHVLIDGGYQGTPPLIMASIAQLGFDTRHVKILLNSEPHFDHAGGLAELQRVSAAALYASAPSAEALESGGIAEDSYLLYKLLVWARLARYPSARVARRVNDGDTVRLGPIALTAHITGGHTRGCTTWSFPVQDGDRTLQVVSACSLTLLPSVRLTDPQRYAGIRADFEHTFATLRSIPADIWVTSHAREFGRYRKFQAQKTAQRPADPFIDREGYRAYIDSGEARFRKLLAEQRRER